MDAEKNLIKAEEKIFFPAISLGWKKIFMYDITKTGKRLKELRNRMGKTQEQAAAEMGINIKTYQAMEQGLRGGSIDTLFLLSEYFEVPMDYLVKGTLSDVERIFFRLSKTKREKLARIIKDLVRTLEW